MNGLKTTGEYWRKECQSLKTHRPGLNPSTATSLAVTLGELLHLSESFLIGRWRKTGQAWWWFRTLWGHCCSPSSWHVAVHKKTFAEWANNLHVDSSETPTYKRGVSVIITANCPNPPFFGLMLKYYRRLTSHVRKGHLRRCWDLDVDFILTYNFCNFGKESIFTYYLFK